MPYIVTTKRPIMYGEPIKDVSRRAVATHAQALLIASGVYQQAVGYRKNLGAEENLRRQAEDFARWGSWDVPESGGTVGPLPDGTVIEVERVTWGQLAYRAFEKQEILDAYKARQA
jgi:hypothetical protein